MRFSSRFQRLSCFSSMSKSSLHNQPLAAAASAAVRGLWRRRVEEWKSAKESGTAEVADIHDTAHSHFLFLKCSGT